MNQTILHIVYWYPNEKNMHDGIWVKNHIDSLHPHCLNRILHLQIFKSIIPMLVLKKKEEMSVFRMGIWLPWRLIEIMSTILIIFYCKCIYRSDFDLLNFHVAYPNCVYNKQIGRLLKKPLLITEHSSGYHFNFTTSRIRLKRVIRMFHSNAKWIAISKVLKNDLIKFSGRENLDCTVIPNTINEANFNNINAKPERYFLLVSRLSYTKKPEIIIKAFEKIAEEYGDVELWIVGGVFSYDSISRNYQISKAALKNIKVLGVKNNTEISTLMKNSLALVHCTKFETFSVVCGEALCCGTPVIASAVGGIAEFVDANNGILVKENTIDNFKEAMAAILNQSKFNRENISRNSLNKFSLKIVGEQYYNVLRNLMSL